VNYQPSSDVSVSATVSPVFSSAFIVNGFKVIPEVVIENQAGEATQPLTLQVSADAPLSKSYSLDIDPIPVGGRVALRDLDDALQFSAASIGTEAVPSAIVFRVLAGETVLVESRTPIRALPDNHWPGIRAYPEILACWVQPNHPALLPIVEATLEHLKRAGLNASIDGYQSKDPQRVFRMLEAMFNAVSEHGIRYVSPPASFETRGQKIRSLEQLLSTKQGSCLDLTMLMLSLVHHMGLNGVAVLVDGHAYLGAWLLQDRFHELVVEDALTVAKRVQLGELALFDSSAVTTEMDFEKAQAVAVRELVKPQNFRALIDIETAFVSGVHPMSSSNGEAFSSNNQSAALPSVGTAMSPRQSRAPVEGEDQRDIVDRWAAKLLDLSGRNKLLNFRATRKALPLLGSEAGPIEDVLASGQRLTILPRPKLTHAQSRWEDIDKAELRTQQAAAAIQRNLVYGDLAAGEFDKNILEVYRHCRSEVENAGSSPLYLGIGMLEWVDKKAQGKIRRAPLILWPAQLHRPKPGGEWSFSRGEGEPQVNANLLEKLSAEFNMDVGGLYAPPEDDSGLDVERILDHFRQLVKRKEGWRVVNTAVLAEFQFAKFLMWRDLMAKRDELLKRPIVKHLITGSGTGYPLSEPIVPVEKLEERHTAKQLATPIDADPSQLQAILAAASGSSFVLQGPPGTGKSQTITNLVAYLLERGKTVLFVSEKMAALDVVKTRLGRVGLGAYCLELHSAKASGKSVAGQLRESFEHKPSKWKGTPALAARTDDAKQVLNAFAATLRTPTPMGGTVRRVVADLIGDRHIQFVPLDPGCAALKSEESVRQALERAEAAQQALPAVSPVDQHPLRAIGLTNWTPNVERALKEAVASLEASARQLIAAISSAEGALVRPASVDSSEGVRQLSARLALALENPVGRHRALSLPDWHLRVRDAARVIDAGRDYAARVDTLTERYAPSIIDADWAGAAPLVEANLSKGSIARWWNLRPVNAKIKPFLVAARGDWQTVLDDLKWLHEVQSQRDSITNFTPHGEAMFGVLWDGVSSNWDALDAALSWLKRVQEEVEASTGASASAWTKVFGNPPSPALRGAYDGLQEVTEAFDSAMFHYQQTGEVSEASTTSSTFSAVVEECARVLDGMPRLRDWTQWTKRRDALHDVGLRPVVRTAISSGVPLPALTRRALNETWFNQFLETTPLLAQFRGSDHRDTITQFQQLESDLHAFQAVAVPLQIAARIPSIDGPGDELAFIRKQLNRKSRFASPRTLFKRAPNVMKAIKPCVLMSPLSVARFLDPEFSGFDVVIFDEASQIPPWDAIGAIARADQVIIVGDSKQMPPTSFFSATAEPDEDLDESQIIDTESILGEAILKGIPELSLRWHYRSQHESLITFSNNHYYRSELHTFPSSATSTTQTGLSWRHVPGGVYDRGGTRTNKAEAEAIVVELKSIAALPASRRPSVGVLAFSMAQQRLLQDLVEQAYLQDPTLEDRLNASEPLFIKNLENVQGDERDVMLFTVGYGPDKEGRVRMSFGPINRPGGERRLNVAITRARKRMVVFSTLTPEDIDLRRTRQLGVKHLRDFLTYARDGKLPATTHSNLTASFDSPFEEQVYDALIAAGYDVHTQVGCGGYRIDLAVVHPEEPGRYVIAIECDGATYHSSSNARARDRIRENVLRHLGWDFHRVWSTDWWFAHEQAVAELLAAVADAVQGKPVVLETPPIVEAEPEEPEAPEPEVSAPQWAARPSLPHRNRDLAYEAASRSAQARDLEAIVEAYAPIEPEIAIRMLATHWGFSKLGRKLKDIGQHLIKSPRTKVHLVDGDLWADLAPERPELPRLVGGPLKHVADHSHHERALAIRQAVAAGLALSREEAARAGSKALGAGAFTKKVAAAMDAGIELAIRHGWVEDDGEKLVVRYS